MRMLDPPDPGDVVKIDVIEPLGLTVPVASGSSPTI